MKVKLVNERRNGAQTLAVRIARGEALDVARAQWLTAEHWYMLPFRFESDGEESLFYYDVTGCASLDDILRAPLDAGRYAGMLVGVLSVMEQLEAQGMPLDSVLWDPKYTYLAPQGYPLFAVVPATGIRPEFLGERPGLADMLRLLADPQRVRPADAAMGSCQQAFARFLTSVPAVRSAALHDWLAGMFPATVQPRTASSAAADGGSATVAAGVDAGTGKKTQLSEGTLPPSATVPVQAPTNVSANAPTTARLGDTRRAGNADTGATNGAASEAEPEETVLSGSRVEATAAGPSTVTEASVTAGPAVARTPVPRTSSQASAAPGASADVAGVPLPRRNASAGTAASAASVAPVRKTGPLETPGTVQTGMSPAGMPSVSMDSAPDADSEGETILKPSMRREIGFTVRRLRDGRTVTVHARKATIGRSKTADIHMGGNTNVSRVHATVTMLDDGRFSVTDHGSANGTEVGGRALASGGTEYLPSGGDFTLADDTFIVTRL